MAHTTQPTRSFMSESVKKALLSTGLAPQRTYRMAIMPIPPASHRWWLCDEWVNPRKEWAHSCYLDTDVDQPQRDKAFNAVGNQD